ncbi:MAG: DUF2169 domain-containing protein [Deltaproteobacteria bacterium]|nr:DUF2169 domain-containing protein [Deltaproteobacteria bacterium]
MKRVVVAQCDARPFAAGRRAPLSVGLARWRGQDRALSLVVKATFSFAGGGPQARVSVAEPEPIGPALESDLDPARLDYPSDFVLQKPRCDVVVSGHAHAETPQEQIAVSLVLGSLERRFLAASPDRATTTIPLLSPYLRGAAGEQLGPVGVERSIREQEEDVTATFDFAELQCAAEDMQLGELSATAPIALEGLSPRAPRRELTLPGLAPRAFLDSLHHDLLEMPLRCDTLWLDTDFERLVLVWRCIFPTALADHEVDRVIVSLERSAQPREVDDILRWLPRGTVGFAIEETDEPIGDPDELEMARYEVLEHAAEPDTPLEDYAVVCAELAEQDRARDDVLADHDFDERSWTIEERAWTERMGAEADRGDGSLTAEFAEYFVLAQEALKSPIEPRSLEEYGALKRRYDRSHQPAELLKAEGVGFGEWMRLDRHWQKRAGADPKVAARLAALLQADEDGAEG